MEVMEEILDIGCGASSGHQLQLLDKKGVIHIDIRITDFNKQIINVQCDANSLPFREKVFVLSYCSHTLEHVTNPLKVLKEIKRVTKRKAIIKVPSIQGVIDKEAPSHFFTWSKYSLRNILNLVFDKVEVFESYRPYKSALSQLPILSRTALSIMHTLVKKRINCSMRSLTPSEYPCAKQLILLFLERNNLIL